jgi:hypothetical protein
VSWPVIWAVVFYGSAAGAAAVSLLIAVKGVAEIRELLAMLQREGRREREGP